MNIFLPSIRGGEALRRPGRRFRAQPPSCFLQSCCPSRGPAFPKGQSQKRQHDRLMAPESGSGTSLMCIEGREF